MADLPLSQRLKVGILLKHYKGGTYRVMFQSTHTETGEVLIGYYASPSKVVTIEMWSRPKAMFDDLVEHEGQKVPRFVEVTDG